MYPSGEALRNAVAKGDFTNQTSGQAPGYVQANLAILPKEWAWDFLLFAQRNPKPCPILEDANIKTMIPKYRVYLHGKLVDEPTNLEKYWQDDFVYFLIGCSFSFEQALISAGLEIRHITEGCNVPMYVTNIMCQSAGKFQASPMVVSMRPFKAQAAIKAIEVTSDYPRVHGSPVHIGDPSLIGIADLNQPDFGDAVTVNDNEIPVFWACGVTPQKAALVSKPPIMITHAPGYMFVSDISNTALK